MADKTIREAFQDIANAIRAKGVTGTMSPLQMPTKIGTIPGGEKFGATVDNWIGDVDANGSLQKPTNTTFDFYTPDILAFNVTNAGAVTSFRDNVKTINLPNLASIGMAGLWKGFNGKTALTSVDFPSLTTVADYGMMQCFKQCTGLTYANLPSLTTLPSGAGTSALSGAFYGCTNLTSIDLSGLTTIPINSDSLYQICYGCSALTTVHLENLQIANSMVEAFKNCTSLVRIDLHNVTTIMSSSGSEYGMQNAFEGCTSLKYVDLAKWSYCQPIGTMYMFKGCTSLEYVNCSEATAVPNGANASYMFQNTNNTYKVIVPDALYSTWIAASGWSNIASHIVKAGDYIAVLTNHGGQSNMDDE